MTTKPLLARASADVPKLTNAIAEISEDHGAIIHHYRERVTTSRGKTVGTQRQLAFTSTAVPDLG